MLGPASCLQTKAQLPTQEERALSRRAGNPVKSHKDSEQKLLLIHMLLTLASFN